MGASTYEVEVTVSHRGEGEFWAGTAVSSVFVTADDRTAAQLIAAQMVACPASAERHGDRHPRRGPVRATNPFLLMPS